MTIDMLCKICRKDPCTVCAHCLTITLRDYHKFLDNCTQSLQRRVNTINTYLHNRVSSLQELTTRVQNVQREVIFTRQLVTRGQAEVDHLRDTVARRKEILDHAHRGSQDSWRTCSTKLKARNKANRKDWKLIYQAIVSERRRLVRASLEVHGIKPPTTKGCMGISDEHSCQVGGLRAPSILALREWHTENAIYIIDLLAQCSLLISNYLGVYLPYEIQLASSSRRTVALLAGSGSQPRSVSLRGDIEQSSGALACLVRDVQFLCHTQGLPVERHNANIANLLYGLVQSDLTGQYSDDTAFSASRGKRKPKTDFGDQGSDLHELATRIACDLKSEPFEFIEHNDQLHASHALKIELVAEQTR